jgi:hypothetical protein
MIIAEGDPKTSDSEAPDEWCEQFKQSDEIKQKKIWYSLNGLALNWINGKKAIQRLEGTENNLFSHLISLYTLNLNFEAMQPSPIEPLTAIFDIPQGTSPREKINAFEANLNRACKCAIRHKVNPTTHRKIYEVVEEHEARRTAQNSQTSDSLGK